MLLLILYADGEIVRHLYDLHSTMLLLILSGDGCISRLRLCIYIPLCFYLYCLRGTKFRFSLAFTFHYASTYTNCTEPENKDNLTFTFHYASTYTFKPGQKVRCNFEFTFHYASTYTHRPILSISS